MILLSKKKYYNDSTYSYRENRISFVDNPEQKELNRLIRDNNTKIIFCTGHAGTGKTFCTLYTSYQLVRENKYDKILFSRNPVQLGEDMGFLPGDAHRQELGRLEVLAGDVSGEESGKRGRNLAGRADRGLGRLDRAVRRSAERDSRRMRREADAGADDRRHREPRGRIADARGRAILRGDGRRTHVRPGAERERSELRIGVLLESGRKAKSRKPPKEIAQIYGKLSKAGQAEIGRHERPEKAKALANADESAAIEFPKANAREMRFAPSA